MAFRKRILVAAEWFPPAFRAGGPVRSVANLVEVLGETHEVFVVAGAYDLGLNTPLEVPHNTWIEHPWGQVQYLTRDRWQSGLWHHLLVETLQPDVLYVNSLYARFFALMPVRTALKCPDMQVVLAPRGMLGAGSLAIKPVKKRIFLQVSRWLGWFDEVVWHATSEAERADIRAQFPEARVKVAPNLPTAPRAIAEPRRSDRWTLVAVGRMHRIKNLAFGVKALAKALRNAPLPRPIELLLIGPAEDADCLAEVLAAGAGVPGLTIRHEGALPPDAVSKALSTAHFLLMPSRHENFGHAIVEAWAHGCPVLLSDRTPWKGLEAAGAGWDWPLEERVWEEGLAQVLALEEAAWNRLSEASRAHFATAVRTPESLEANRRIFSA
jgi:glycosyltransferase involved in cell wall biosynthesis